MDFVDYEEVAISFSPGDIAIMKSILQSAGVTYHIQGEMFSTAYPYVQPVRVLVDSTQADDARILLTDFIKSHQ